ncbi:LysR family transcriptional regulator (plasmid) [Mycolicibacterium arabiense]|uniref:Probable hydrogen peroxide-inducible genes activator n=1 Tax=Mycolicibacterium arabiense TaxID=1286181 RepID=A0A7I7RQ13_9MYCO|nr:LysR family transcriptional regulator [Mycolicibacterium arabiense]MCV7372001.1 LysR family transcriptional regulator [Mycolicibacterium arabiense]BBY46678.1 LysR family transcriptional regulator [Mycolicibacterium arabiense]
MDLRELRTFVAVVEEGRFAGAAHRLNLSQPAISHTIRGLEKQCGVVLLERTSSGVVTTTAGKLLVVEARAVLARYEQAVAAMSQNSGEEASLAIGMPFGLPAGLLSSALATLAATYPSTSIAVRQLSTARQIDALGRAELDLALLRHRPSKADLDAVLISDEPLGVIVSERQAERLGPSDEVGLESLVGLGLDWHGFPRDSSPVWYDELTSTLRSYGLHIEPSASYTEELVPDVTYASVSLGRSFGLAAPSCQSTLPPPIKWRRLTGDPLRLRTWAAWSASSRRRDLGHLVSLLEDGASETYSPSPCIELQDASQDALAS